MTQHEQEQREALQVSKVEVMQAVELPDLTGWKREYKKMSEASQKIIDLHNENWRAGYDVLTEGALGDYPEE
tara:strand:+ start:358 stop:573 length:216 start_codon:yes stop_codon:yes gene_type:complete